MFTDGYVYANDGLERATVCFYLFMKAITYTGLIFKLLVFIFFIYHFIKKTPTICTLYFSLLIFGYFWDIATLLVGVIRFTNECFKIFDAWGFMLASDILQWYWLGFGNLLVNYSFMRRIMKKNIHQNQSLLTELWLRENFDFRFRHEKSFEISENGQCHLIPHPRNLYGC